LTNGLPEVVGENSDAALKVQWAKKKKRMNPNTSEGR